MKTLYGSMDKPIDEAQGGRWWPVVAAVTAGALITICGCSRFGQSLEDIERARAKKTAKEIKSITEVRFAIYAGAETFKLSGELRAYIRTQLNQQRDARGLAAIINVKGLWQKEIWHGVFAEIFAEQCTSNRPFRLVGTEATVRALRSLAMEEGGTRGRKAAVAAAIAIKWDEPNVARDALLKYYADFAVVAPSDFPRPSEEPLRCDLHLIRLGIHLPAPMTSVEDVRSILTTWPISEKKAYSDDVLAEVGTRYNDLLRKQLAEGNRNFEMFLGRENRSKTVRSLVDQVRAEQSLGE